MDDFRKNGKAIMKKILLIFLVLIVAAAVLQIARIEKRNKKNEEDLQNSPNMISAYLQDKYGKSFYVNPHYEVYSGGPIPGKRYTPYMYEVREFDVDGYVFNVQIYPVATYDKTIEDIRDNYCWKFLNIKTKEWFKKELAEILPQEYKFILHSMYSIAYYDYNENIKPDLPLEAYYETRTSPVSLTLEIIIPPYDILQNAKCTENNVKNIINEFRKKTPNSRIEFYLLQTETREEYEKINERELENVPFFVHRDWINVWDIADTKTVMEIEVGQDD